MATSSIASLFGKSAEEIVYEKQKADEEREYNEYLASLQAARETPGLATGMAFGKAAGRGLKQIAGGLLGQSPAMEDPRLAKALEMRKIFDGITQSDLNNPAKLETLVQKLLDTGNTEAAFQLDQMATNIRKAQEIELDDPTIFNYQGQQIRGGYYKGRAVGFDAAGNMIYLPADATPQIKMRTATKEERTQAGEILKDGYDIKDNSIQAIVANEAVTIMEQENVSYPEAIRRSLERRSIIGSQEGGEFSVQDLGLTGTPGPGEAVWNTGDRLQIYRISDGKVIEEGRQFSDADRKAIEEGRAGKIDRQKKAKAREAYPENWFL